MTDQHVGVAARIDITVEADQAEAFRVFTEQFATWWPLATHHIGAQPAATAVMEPRVGGRWFERAADGTVCDWGDVRVWEPPSRLVLVWRISADWTYDPSFETEIEVRFTAVGPGRTHVALEHRGLEAFGARAEEMRSIFLSPGGWTGLLEAFAAASAAAGSSESTG
jgi:hypothetical protein